nr:hypothetical protein [Tanacetum cinerariifolium]
MLRKIVRLQVMSKDEYVGKKYSSQEGNHGKAPGRKIKKDVTGSKQEKKVDVFGAWKQKEVSGITKFLIEDEAAEGCLLWSTVSLSQNLSRAIVTLEYKKAHNRKYLTWFQLFRYEGSVLILLSIVVMNGRKAFLIEDEAAEGCLLWSTVSLSQTLSRAIVTLEYKKAHNRKYLTWFQLFRYEGSVLILMSIAVMNGRKATEKMLLLLDLSDIRQGTDIHDPNEMVDISDDIDLVNYDEEDPKEDPEEEPKEDVDIEHEDNAELIFPYEVEGDKTPPPEDVSSDSVSFESESEDEESSSARDSSNVDGLAPWALRRDLEASCARARIMEVELGTYQTEIAILRSKDKIRGKERELLNHDLENVKRALGNVLERMSVLESRENAILKKRLAETETETKLVWARMERKTAERRLHESRVWNKRFYLDMVRIRAVSK